MKAGGKYEYIDRTGTVAFAVDNYPTLESFHGGYAIYRKEMMYGFIGKDGNVAIPAAYRSAWDFHGGFARVETNDGVLGFVDAKGKFTPVKRATNLCDFSCGLARYESNGLYGFVDSSGRVAIKPRYQEAKDFVSGVAAVRKDGRWGLVNASGKALRPCAYDFATVFEGALALCGNEDDFTYVDLKGKKVWPRGGR